jgi:putative ABC transport system substrate-binding protein
MKRREFILLAGGAVAGWPLAALAQQAGKLYRIGFLWESPGAFPERIEAFRQGLRDLGYVEGQDIAIEYRWAEGKPERIRELAEELVRLKVDVIITASSIQVLSTSRRPNGRPRRSPSSSSATRTRSPPAT